MKTFRFICFWLMIWVVTAHLVVGPLVYLTISLRPSQPVWAYTGLVITSMVIIVPCYPTAYACEPFHAYLTWWVRKADPGISAQSHQEFRDDINALLTTMAFSNRCKTGRVR